MKNFLFEIGTEEMPFWAVESGITQLKENAEKLFNDNGIKIEGLKVTGGPRRLVLLAMLAERQEERIIETKGPAYSSAFDKKGKPLKAVEGFARSHGVSINDLVIKEQNGGKYVYAVKKVEPKETVEFLKEKLPGLIQALNFEKSMKWDDSGIRFVRPIRWIVCLFGDQVVEVKIGNLIAGRQTQGHRFLSQGKIVIKDVSLYEEELEKKGNVIVDKAKRREVIIEEANKVCQNGAEPVFDEKVLSEVTQLVEYPNAILGVFEEKYLSLPDEVLITAMEAHQRYFPVKDKNTGKLLPNFIVIHNGDPEHEAIIREGNERVIRARLADADFFFKEDVKVSLKSRVPKLDGVIFQKKLGTLLQKTNRVVELAGITSELFGFDGSMKDFARRAAYLAKVDLLTGMVSEFPELQGVMGKIYALEQGEVEEVALAIYEHYLPRFSGDILPRTAAGTTLSVADKLDTIVGYFLCGLEPTGSEDPYSLRRQAQGTVNIIINSEKDFDLSKALLYAVEGYSAISNLRNPDETLTSLKEFFKTRFQWTMSQKGFNVTLVSSLLSYFLKEPKTSLAKLEALSKWSDDGRLEDILTAYQRVRNLSNSALGVEVETDLLKEKEELILFEAVKDAALKYSDGKPGESLKLLWDLKASIDFFFDTVLVMTENQRVRDNRLRLLNMTRALFEKFADFSAMI